MELTSPDIVITDASVLINFLAIDRMDLIAAHPGDFLVTGHVMAEVTDEFTEQQTRLQIALEQEIVQQISVDDPVEVELFGRLQEHHRLGVGECSAIAVAIKRGHRIAIDDKRAKKQALKLHQGLQIITTQDLMVELIHNGTIDVTGADAIKALWASEHGFRLGAKSFQELV